MKLVIGFAVHRDEAAAYEKGGDPPLMFTHAFNLNKHGEVHDPTWGSEGIQKYRYYGKVVPDHIAHSFKSHVDLMNWFGRHFQTGNNRGPSSIHMGQQQPIQHTPDL